ncbi:hypothetical protein CAEBREN_04034 [Caenorhabditis brenneri]|uniref:Uncharacterized protein n=1 Tax=Caenorhabditis brenneri TaxID=135651 RepID=G0MCE0_CAEBE|nr:hypothetical protein CAEBREN_04034 [Caenorhabditis brenneri]
MTPSGNLLAETARATLISLKEKDAQIVESYAKLTEKLEKRRTRANEMAAQSNVTPIGSIDFSIRQMKKPRLVELRTDFLKKPTESAQKNNSNGNWKTNNSSNQKDNQGNQKNKQGQTVEG